MGLRNRLGGQRLPERGHRRSHDVGQLEQPTAISPRMVVRWQRPGPTLPDGTGREPLLRAVAEVGSDLVARRPEDMGLEPDPAPAREDSANRDATASSSSGNAGSFAETNFTVGQALRTRAFWILAVFSGASMMVQAGVSLHQVSHYINQGIDPRFAALSASTFALAQMPATVFWAALARRMPIRFLMTGASFVVTLAAAGTALSDRLLPEIVSAAGVGFGVGGLHLLIRLVWADYYGRQNLGTIRGLTMSVQVGGQALGPVIAGFMFDYFDSYRIPFTFFAVAVFLAGIMALAAKPPEAPSGGERIEQIGA